MSEKKSDVRLFEYVVFYKGATDAAAALLDSKPKILIQPTTVLAENERAVNIMAARAIPTEYDDKLNDVVVVVRPF